MVNRVISGAAAPEAPPQPVEIQDTINSTAYAKILDLIGEGEIEGWADVNPAKCVYLDGVPVMAKDGTENVKGVQFVLRHGTASQAPIPGFDFAESEKGVGVVVKNGQPVSRTVDNLEATRARINLSWAALLKQHDNGDVVGTSVQFTIEVAPVTGTFVTMLDQTISEKSRDQYDKSVLVNLAGEGPWTVRVTRITPNAGQDDDVQDEFYWSSMAELVDVMFTFPHSALAFIQIDSSKFSSIPTRGYDLKLRKVKIPVNYYPEWTDTERHVGIWNGQFKVQWTCNPAWVMYDLLTEKRFALGSFVADINPYKWDFYELSKYCDELVPDGFGGMERRFECHTYIQEQSQAYALLAQLSALFRGAPLSGGSSISVMFDGPRDPELLFNESNVVDGKFSYTSTARRYRHNAIYVSWFDGSNGGNRVVEYVPDDKAISENGFLPLSLDAFGCSSKGQAIRAARWMLYSSQNETETVSFKAGVEAALARPGTIIEVNDSTRMGVKQAGRLLSVNAMESKVTLDRPVTLLPFVEYQISFLSVVEDMATGGFKHAVESVEVLELPGTHTEITIGGGLTTAPTVSSVFSISGTDVQSMLARVIGVEEEEPGVYRVNAQEHNPNKYDFVEQNIPLQTPNTVRNLTPAAVTGLAIRDNLYIDASNVKVLVDVSWQRNSEHTQFMAMWRRDNGDWVTASTVTGTGFQITDALPGLYDVRVTAYNMFDRPSPVATLSGNIKGKLAPPADVDPASIQVTLEEAGIRITWGPVPDLDLAYYEVRVGDTWDADSTQLVERAVGATAFFPAVQGTIFTFHIRPRDTSDNWSNSVATKVARFDPPAGVTGFTVTQIDTKLDFSWDAPVGGARYELRATDPDVAGGWEVGEKIAESRTNHVIIEWGRTGSKIFWIKAYDVLGNASAEAVSLNRDVALLPNKNVVIDKRLGGVATGAIAWGVGVTGYRYEVSGTVVQVPRGSSYGELYYNLQMPKTFNVAVSVDMKQTAVMDDTMTWESALFSWESVAAQRPWVFIGDVGDIEIRHYVAVKGEVDPGLVWQAALNGAVASSNGAPAVNLTTGYAVCRYGQGAVMAPCDDLTYSLPTLPAEFTARATFKVAQILTAFAVMQLSIAAGSVRVYYSPGQQSFIARSPEGQLLKVFRPLQVGDVVFVALTQFEGEFRLAVRLLGDTLRATEIPRAATTGPTQLLLK